MLLLRVGGLPGQTDSRLMTSAWAQHRQGSVSKTGVPLEMTSPSADSPLCELLKARINGSFFSKLFLLQEGTSARPLHHHFLGSKPRGER